MTVEALLEQLRNEETVARGMSFHYGAKAMDNDWYDEEERAEFRNIADCNHKEAERLRAIIREIEKRVA